MPKNFRPVSYLSPNFQFSRTFVKNALSFVLYCCSFLELRCACVGSLHSLISTQQLPTQAVELMSKSAMSRHARTVIPKKNTAKILTEKRECSQSVLDGKRRIWEFGHEFCHPFEFFYYISDFAYEVKKCRGHPRCLFC